MIYFSFIVIYETEQDNMALSKTLTYLKMSWVFKVLRS